MQKLSSLSVVLPAYNDEFSLPNLIKELAKLLPKISRSFEIIVVNDGSRDQTGKVLKDLQTKYSFLKIKTHPKNLGYGAALIDGFKTSRMDFIFYTDSDGQYQVSQLVDLIKALEPETEMVAGYKTKRDDSFLRKFLGKTYNRTVKGIFHLKIKDVDCDFRLFKREILKNLVIKSQSGSFDAEFMLKLQKRGVKIKEIPVSHFSRQFGKSQFFAFRMLATTFIDLLKLLIYDSFS